MGLLVEREQAIIRFGQALALARSDAPLPEAWLDRTRRIGASSNMTFTPVLGTALLAKATDDSVDALSLRVDESHKGYSARSLAKEVLVPCCVRAGIDLRNKGPEPLNNQPFLRADRVTASMRVKANARPDLLYLVDTLEHADFLRGTAAVEALAAFLRVRIAESVPVTKIELGPGVLDVSALGAALAALLRGDAEGGKVGQAVGAAFLDGIFGEVRTKKINDPSNKWPGDVGVFDRDVQILGVEVKQKPVAQEELLLFTRRLQDAELHRGLVFAFRQEALVLDVPETKHQARRLHGVELSIIFDASTALDEVVRYAPRDVTLSLAKLPRDVLARMEELEVSPKKLHEWAAYFATEPAGPEPAS